MPAEDRHPVPYDLLSNHLGTEEGCTACHGEEQGGDRYVPDSLLVCMVGIPREVDSVVPQLAQARLSQKENR